MVVVPISKKGGFMTANDGTVALVTGATSGIGRAAAAKLADNGVTVIVHGRDAARGAEVVDAIQAKGGMARFVAADLSDSAEFSRFIADVGAVDVLVNNAGISWFGPTADLDVATYDRLFNANVRPAYFLVAALAPKMVAQGGGSIINVGSMAGQIGMVGGAAYSAYRSSWLLPRPPPGEGFALPAPRVEGLSWTSPSRRW
jgi:NADP-dependent 3-hydroxy acid dehydrogenase YdfG